MVWTTVTVRMLALGTVIGACAAGCTATLNAESSDPSAAGPEAGAAGEGGVAGGAPAGGAAGGRNGGTGGAGAATTGGRGGKAGAGEAGEGSGGASVAGAMASGGRGGTSALGGRGGTTTGGGEGGSGTGGVPPQEASRLSVDPSGRYFVNESGAPIRIESVSLWMLGNHGTVPQQNATMDAIKTRGFNAFVLMNIVREPDGTWATINEPNDIEDNPPFTTPYDFSTPNDAYFDRIADLIERAGERGLYVFFFHTYMGNEGGNDGWEGYLIEQSDAVVRDWGVYLGNKFPHPNIVWMHMGDHRISDVALSKFQLVVEGIQSVARDRLASSELDDPDDRVVDQPGFSYGIDPATSDMNLDWVYSLGPDYDGLPYTTIDEAYTASSVLPVLTGEPHYEGYEGHAHNDRASTRRLQYMNAFAGATAGANYGPQQDLWSFQPNGYADALETAALSDQTHRLALFRTIDWTLLRPSGTASASAHGSRGSSAYCGRRLIVSNAGSGSSLIVSSMASDGSKLLAYVPPGGSATRTFGVDLRSMAADTEFSWFDPTTGETTAAGTYANTEAAQDFTTPGSNGSGEGDWVLVGSQVAARGIGAAAKNRAAVAPPRAATRPAAPRSTGGAAPSTRSGTRAPPARPVLRP